ncbi:phiSA1p31-related protein [Streptomyces sp. NPDC058280]|uniref:phiSA1p31-related protein n=1 Tax=Streptomyces sp. NPDC058280 TaxID=3346419 RepID=UPI0036E3C138
MPFAINDRVTHSSFGPGEILFGPFDHAIGSETYLMKKEGGKAVLAAASFLEPAGKFKVGDAVSDVHTKYTVKGGPFFGPVYEWYAITSAADGIDYQSNARGLTLVSPAGELHTVDGVTYDLTAEYRDRDGDTWRFAEVNGVIRGEMYGVVVTERSTGLSSVIREYGPLTRIAD